jgi:hypothetical protein
MSWLSLTVALLCQSQETMPAQAPPAPAVTTTPAAAPAAVAAPAPVPAAEGGPPPPAPPPGVVSPPPAAEPSPDRGHGGVAVELSTGGLTSGGFLIGIATKGGAVVGLTADYRRVTVDLGGDMETVTAGSRFGAGLRVPLITTRDGRGDMVLAVDFAYGTDKTTTKNIFPEPPQNDGDGLSFAFGPGLRYWILDQLAVGYVVRFRTTSLNYRDVYSATGSSTTIGIEGAFQVTATF